MEDSQTDVFLVKKALAAHGLKVDLKVLEDGEQALNYIGKLDLDPSASCPSLFLVDLNLPRTSGLEVLAHVRRSEKCANLPVVITTSSDAPKDRAESAALGATAYFIKPCGYDAFLRIGEIIQKLLGRSAPDS